MKDSEITEIYKKQKQAEIEIEEILQKFEKETGFTIRNVDRLNKFSFDSYKYINQDLDVGRKLTLFIE